MNSERSNKMGLWIASIVILLSLVAIGYQVWRYLNISPQISFEYLQSVKVGQSVRFTNTSDFVSESGNWEWDFGDKSEVVNSFHALHSFPTTGTFGVTLTYKAENGQLYIKKAAVVVYLPFPEAAFEIEGGNNVTGQEIIIKNTSTDATDYIWQLGDGTSSDAFEPTVVYNKPGIYSISLIAVNDIGQLDEFGLELSIGSEEGDKPVLSQDEVLIKHIAIFDEGKLSSALTNLANSQVSRSEKRKIRNDILRDVSSLGIMINDMTLENYLNKIQLEASSKQVRINVTLIERNKNNKISGISIN